MANGDKTGMSVKPKVQVVIEHLDHAAAHLNEAGRKLAAVVMDIEKGADWIAQYRDSMIKALEETGGDVAPAIESQIRDFIPKHLRNGDGDAGPQA